MVYVGLSVLKLPTPYVPSVKRKCDNCECEVWIHSALIGQADSAEKIICLDCMQEESGIKPKKGLKQ